MAIKFKLLRIHVCLITKVKIESRPCIKEQKVLLRGKIGNTARLNEKIVGCETK